MRKYLVLISCSFLFIFSSLAKHQNEPYEPHSWGKFKVKGSDNYYKFESELIEDKSVKKEIKNNQKTGLISYLLFEDNKIIIDEEDLPYYIKVDGSLNSEKSHLVIPYSLDVNDMRFASPQGFNSGEQFYCYLKDAFDTLYLEGETNPKMMSIGLHCRIIGRPGRFSSLVKFISYIQQFDDIWVCTREDIANHWLKNHLPV